MELYLIWAFYWLFLSGLIRMYCFFADKKQEYSERVIRRILIFISVLGLVFLFCGFHYLFQALGFFLASWFDWLFLVPLAISLGVLFNFFSVKQYLQVIENFTNTYELKRQQDFFLNGIEKNCTIKLAVLDFSRNKKNPLIVWSSDYFLYWANRYIDDKINTLFEQYFYDIFPLPFAWRKAIRKALSDNDSYSVSEYWEKTNRHIKLEAISLQDEKVLIYFFDTTEQERQNKELKEINKELLELGLKKLKKGEL